MPPHRDLKPKTESEYQIEASKGSIGVKTLRLFDLEATSEDAAHPAIFRNNRHYIDGSWHH